jgi:hypothetical protein
MTTASNKVFTLRLACPSGNLLWRLREYKPLGAVSLMRDHLQVSNAKHLDDLRPFNNTANN